MKDKNKKAKEILASDLSAIVNHKQIKSKLSNHKTLSERQFTPVFYNKYIFSGFQKKCYKAWWKKSKERKKENGLKWQNKYKNWTHKLWSYEDYQTRSENNYD